MTKVLLPDGAIFRAKPLGASRWASNTNRFDEPEFSRDRIFVSVSTSINILFGHQFGHQFKVLLAYLIDRQKRSIDFEIKL
ncbi:MAG: hypothetical protein O3A90_16415 [Proteobacteria bacterium]|nr:hypothetical protein [Pseudomonadota bacterium]MDA0850799.1 hypothetical protein [Pseudomonadota bacterium]MDA1294361.1 hypothetical protein [Pseudomonadota bacterium]